MLAPREPAPVAEGNEEVEELAGVEGRYCSC